MQKTFDPGIIPRSASRLFIPFSELTFLTLHSSPTPRSESVFFSCSFYFLSFHIFAINSLIIILQIGVNSEKRKTFCKPLAEYKTFFKVYYVLIRSFITSPAIIIPATDGTKGTLAGTAFPLPSSALAFGSSGEKTTFK